MRAFNPVLETMREYTAYLGIDPDSIIWLKPNSARTTRRIKTVMTNLGLRGHLEGKTLVVGPDCEEDPESFIRSWSRSVWADFEKLKDVSVVQEVYGMELAADVYNARSNGELQARYWPRYDIRLELEEEYY